MKRRRFYNNKNRGRKWTEPEVGRPIDFADKYSDSDKGSNKFVKADNSRSSEFIKRKRAQKKKLTALSIFLAAVLVLTGFFIADVHMQRRAKPVQNSIAAAQKKSAASEISLSFSGRIVPSVALDGGVMLTSVITEAQKDGKTAIMFDAKRADGTIGYLSNLTTVSTFSLISAEGVKPADSFKMIKENDIIPVARVYTYLDNALPKLYDEAALTGKKKLFRDSDGNTYLDPESETAYSYIKDIINELSSMGITDIVLDGCTVNETDYFSKLTSRLNNDIEGELRFYKAVSVELKGFDAESGDINEAGIKNDISKFPKPGENSVLIIKTDLEEESYKAFLEEKGITAYITES